MSELQIVLLLVGVLVIIGVVIYNRVQESRFKARAEDAFAPATGDVLLENGAARERIEPQFQHDAHHDDAPAERQEPRAIHDGPADERPGEAVLKAGDAGPGLKAPAAAVAAPAAPPAAAPAKPASVMAGVAALGDEAAVAEGAPQPATARAAPAAEPAPSPQRGAAAPADGDALASIVYSAEVVSKEQLLPSAVDQLARALGPLSGRVQLLGRQKSTDAWDSVDLTAPKAVRELRARLQLVDRRGAITQQDIVIFQSAVARCAASSGASASIPDAAPALARSRELDDFCADVDVAVGINLVAQPGRPFPGTRLRGLAEAAGFRLERGAFVYPDGHGGARFTLEQQSGAQISADSLRTLHATALTLLLDVPRLADGVAAFDQMVGVGRQLAQSLGASLVDDNQVPVSESGLEQIRNQLRAIYKTMDSHGIPAGSAAALRLFS
jgi:FtsZ-interacting cell division protein ZipA